MKRPLLAGLLGLVLLATLTGAKECQPPPPSPSSGTAAGGKCDESCTLQPDTVTLQVIWYPVPVKGVPNATGEITWSKAGVQQANEHHRLDPVHFHLWHGWEHDWAKQGYPRITLTGDTNSTPEQWGGVYCSIEWLDPKTQRVTFLASVHRGPDAGPGSVTCDSDVGAKALHLGGK